MPTNDTTTARYRGRIRGSQMPWEPLTPEEVEEVEERYGPRMEIIFIPTPLGLLEIRRENDGSGTA